MNMRAFLGLCAGLFVVVGAAEAQRLSPVVVNDRDVPRLEARFGNAGGSGGLASGSCETQTSTHTDASFDGGVYVVQAGFAEQEIAAVSYTLPPGSFPIKLERAEMIFATSQSNQLTETEWSFLVWEGTPSEGELMYVYSSDGKLLPHIRLEAGTSGVNVQVSVDPNDADQMILNDDGTRTFSIGYRIDEHHSQTQNPCFVAPPTCCNAFPTTDSTASGGLAEPTQNWIYAIDCGLPPPLACRAGWSRFSEFGICSPSGDWVMRALWSSVNCNVVGACCLANGSCADDVTEVDCKAIAGAWGGDGSICGDSSCETPTDDVPCCFEATGGCVPLSLADCLGVDGVPGPEGVSCAEHICFPEGAVCMPDGSCLDGLTPEDAAAMGGMFMGDGTTCAGTTCPEPEGACCFANGACILLTEAECAVTGADWAGMDTTCADGDGDGDVDDCVLDLIGDLNGDGQINGADLTIVLGEWGTDDPIADIDGSGTVDGADLTIILGGWTF